MARRGGKGNKGGQKQPVKKPAGKKGSKRGQKPVGKKDPVKKPFGNGEGKFNCSCGDSFPSSGELMSCSHGVGKSHPGKKLIKNTNPAYNMAVSGASKVAGTSRGNA